MGLEIRQVQGRADLRRFIFLPEKIHALHMNWVPPIYLAEWGYFNPGKNPAFSYCDTILLLAWEGDAVVGRVMGIINHRYNEFRKEKNARFALLETHEDGRAVHTLLDRVERWAAQKGMTRIIGPYGFSDQDPEGFIIEGFEHRATIATYYNFEWMPRLVEAHGYTKEVDYVTYRIPLPEVIPENLIRMFQRIEKRGGLEALEVTTRREARHWAKSAFHLMNEAYTEAGIYGFAPMDEGEMDELLKRYLPVIDPRFLKGARKGNDLVGFVIGIPDMTEGLQKARGRLFPFGLFWIMRARRKARQLDLLLGAVKEADRGKGADVLMMVAMMASTRKAGMEIADSHHQMETNKRMRAVSEFLGGEIYKRHRVYQKRL